MPPQTRRQFVGNSFGVATALALRSDRAAVATGPQDSAAVGANIDLPRGRVPLSFIIDDSTCLVNMGKFCMPQFAATYPQRAEYQKPWRDWPAEIPDAFVRKFGEWCAAHGVKGKYSVVPYPACVGWLDRLLPGWSHKELRDSLQLVRELMTPHWDIHPEMITHTRVIDLKSGRPTNDFSPASMENSYPQSAVSTDYLASYMAYALRILKNCELPCTGITTPGGFGNRVKEKLPVAVAEAVQDVFAAEIPHYFKYVVDTGWDTEPIIETLEPLRDDEIAPGKLPKFAVNIPAGTGDWFGGWDGTVESQPQRYASADATSGRLVELIEARRPALMLCHWPGMYCHGTESGFRAFQAVVTALHSRFADQVLWMKLSEIARYWAARFWSDVLATEAGLRIVAPFSCPLFTVRIDRTVRQVVLITPDGASTTLQRVASLATLDQGQWFTDGKSSRICWHLQQGVTELLIQ
ncbi:MAG: hypothetical protein KatS3mg111_1548 [Pirellulaceae bacterium]|nr:MAG: hypothetical protein KatS3mg111_1548 [Pirellulaceae bacterium]